MTAQPAARRPAKGSTDHALHRAAMTAAADPRPTVASMDRDGESFPMTLSRLGNTATVWACCVSTIGPVCRHRQGMPPLAPSARFEVALRRKTTAQLLAAREVIDGSHGPTITEEERLVAGYAGDVIEKRYPQVVEHLLEQIAADADMVETYSDMLLRALARITR